MHDCFVVSVSKGQRPAQCFCDSLKLSVFRCHAALFHYVTCAVSFLSSFWGVYITWIIETTRFLVLLKNVVALPEKAVTVGFILSVLISYLLSYYPGDMDTWRDAYLFFLLWKLVLWQSRNHDVSCKTITGVDFFFFKYVYRTDTGDGCGGGKKKLQVCTQIWYCCLWTCFSSDPPFRWDWKTDAVREPLFPTDISQLMEVAFLSASWRYSLNVLELVWLLLAEKFMYYWGQGAGSFISRALDLV